MKHIDFQLGFLQGLYGRIIEIGASFIVIYPCCQNLIIIRPPCYTWNVKIVN